MQAERGFTSTCVPRSSDTQTLWVPVLARGLGGGDAWLGLHPQSGFDFVAD